MPQNLTRIRSRVRPPSVERDRADPGVAHVHAAVVLVAGQLEGMDSRREGAGDSGYDEVAGKLQVVRGRGAEGGLFLADGDRTADERVGGRHETAHPGRVPAVRGLLWIVEFVDDVFA